MLLIFISCLNKDFSTIQQPNVMQMFVQNNTYQNKRNEKICQEYTSMTQQQMMNFVSILLSKQVK